MGRELREVKTETKRSGEGRAERVPLGGFRQKLSVRHIPRGYAGRWVNDNGGRIQAALQAGYSFVEDEEVKAERAGTNAESDARVSKVVGTREGGHALIAYLMKIPEEFYEQDQAAKRAQIDATEDAIRGGKHARKGEQEYVPDGGISIKRA